MLHREWFHADCSGIDIERGQDQVPLENEEDFDEFEVQFVERRSLSLDSEVLSTNSERGMIQGEIA